MGFEPEKNIEDTKKILDYIRGKKSRSHFDNAIETSLTVREMVSEICVADLKPEEDTALLLQVLLTMIKQIMFDTARIADYCDENKPKKGGTN